MEPHRFTLDQVAAFYRDCFRPDRVFVVAVSDFDEARMEARIRERFSAIPVPGTPPPAVRPAADRRAAARVVFGLPELASTHVTMEFACTPSHGTVLEQGRRRYATHLVWTPVFTWLMGIIHTPGAPLTGFQARRLRLTPTGETCQVVLEAAEGAALDALELALPELERVRRHPVPDPMLEHLKELMWTEVQAALTPPSSAMQADELLRHAMNGEPVRDREAERSIARLVIPTLTAADLQEAAQGLLAEHGRSTVISLPTGEGLGLPTAADIAAVETRVASRDPGAWERPPALEVGRVQLPPAATIEAIEREESSGFEVWRLSNGLEVWARPTDLEPGRVSFLARATHGLLHLDEDLRPAGALATAVLARSGLGPLSPAEVRELRAARVDLAPLITSTDTALSGSVATADLESMLHLAHLRFTAPRFEEDALTHARVEERDAPFGEPDPPLLEALWSVTWPPSIGDYLRDEATIDRIRLEQTRAAYEALFQDASEFRFVFIGDFEPASLRPLAAQYLGSLPAGDAEPRGPGWPALEGHHERTVRGPGPDAEVLIALQRPLSAGGREDALLAVLSGVLHMHTVHQLQREGGASMARASVALLDGHYSLMLAFECAPEQAAALEAEALGLIEALGHPAAVHPQDLQVARQWALELRQEDVTTLDFWEGLVGDPSEMPTLDDLREAMGFEADLERVTPERLQAFTRDLLDSGGLVVVRQLPGAADVHR